MPLFNSPLPKHFIDNLNANFVSDSNRLPNVFLYPHYLCIQKWQSYCHQELTFYFTPLRSSRILAIDYMVRPLRL